MKQFLRLLVVPCVVYIVIFIIYSYPAISYFSTKLYSDSFDGLVHFWNLWWINKAVVTLHSSIWYTKYLYYPYGISLYAHSLNPINGIISIPLQQFLTLIQTYNILVIMSYILSGVFTFRLCFLLTKNYAASLIGGFIFAFSAYRFAHTEGHMELITTQALPLFFYYLIRFLNKPNHLTGMKTALSLLLNLLATPYYFIFCILGAGVLISVKMYQKTFIFISKSTLLASLTLVVFAGALAGIYLAPLTTQISKQVTIAYSPEDYSLDLLAPFIFGGHSRFGMWTYFYWSQLPGNIHESSLYVGIIPFVLTIYIFLKHRKNIRKNAFYCWFALLLVFFGLSLGPILHIAGKEIWSIMMPYSILEPFWSLIKIATPVRFFVMTVLAISVIASYGFSELLKKTHGRIIVFVLSVLLFIEYTPKPITLSSLPIPNYVFFLKTHGGKQGVIDLSANAPLRMYYQTVHENPIQFGYLSRIPKATILESLELQNAIKTFDYSNLTKKYSFRYLVNPRQLSQISSCPPIAYKDSEVTIYDLAPELVCN